MHIQTYLTKFLKWSQFNLAFDFDLWVVKWNESKPRIRRNGRIVVEGIFFVENYWCSLLSLHLSPLPKKKTAEDAYQKQKAAADIDPRAVSKDALDGARDAVVPSEKKLTCKL